jgi:hypothetical protein
MPSEQIAQQALAYAAGGWSVLPLWWPTSTGDCACGLPGCDSACKHPIGRLLAHGLHDASKEVDRVEAWWRIYPTANVGIRTGSASDLVVLDVDGDAGRLALRGLIAHHAPFEARWARTGSGGWHAYFAHPGGSLPNSSGRLGEGLDVRGDGGYVVAPPSRHHCGRRYRWIGAADRPPALPQWLSELVAQPGHEERTAQPVWLLSDDVDAYARAAVERETRDVTQAPPGQRNDRLNRAAFKLGQLAGAGLVRPDVVIDALVAAGLAAGPGERKIRITIRSGLRAGMLQPRQVLVRSRDGAREVGSC